MYLYEKSTTTILNGITDYTMMRLRRQNLVKNERITMQSKSERLETQTNTGFDLHSNLTKIDNNPQTLSYHYLNRMSPHVWHKLFPKSTCDVKNIHYACGQSQSLIQRLLLHLNYMFKYKDSIRININKFHELKINTNINGQIHIGSAHPHK